MAYKLPSDATKGRRKKTKGTDGRIWVLVDWQVVYGDVTPNDTMVYENYVPADEDANEFLNRTYGPWNIGPLEGKAISQVRK